LYHFNEETRVKLADAGNHPYFKGKGLCEPWSGRGDPPPLLTSNPTIDRFMSTVHDLWRGDVLDGPACLAGFIPRKDSAMRKLPKAIVKDL
jgi:hypothetical protein